MKSSPSNVAREPDVQRDAPLYPVVLKLAGRPVLVVGGGAVALAKARGLLRCGARVRAVAPSWHPEFASLGAVERIRRPFRPEDLEGVALVVAATGRRSVEETVAREARARGIWCNVADVPDLCGFYLPATLRRGSLQVSVSTEGRAPFLSVVLRDRLASLLGPHLEAVVEALAVARDRVLRRYPDDPERRRRALGDLLTADAVDELLEGDGANLERRMESWKSSPRT